MLPSTSTAGELSIGPGKAADHTLVLGDVMFTAVRRHKRATVQTKRGVSRHTRRYSLQTDTHRGHGTGSHVDTHAIHTRTEQRIGPSADVRDAQPPHRRQR